MPLRPMRRIYRRFKHVFIDESRIPLMNRKNRVQYPEEQGRPLLGKPRVDWEFLRPPQGFFKQVSQNE